MQGVCQVQPDSCGRGSRGGGGGHTAQHLHVCKECHAALHMVCLVEHDSESGGGGEGDGHMLLRP